MPSEITARFPDTEFDMPRQGQRGVDVTVIGGRHPSDYPNSPWPAGVDHGDFKPNTNTGYKAIEYEKSSGKIPGDTIILPYDTTTGNLVF